MGAYLGELMKIVRPCRWALDSQGNGAGSLPVVFADKSETFPVTWCSKRIKNGDEDNVWHKFQILVIDRDKQPVFEFKPEGDAGPVAGKSE